MLFDITENVQVHYQVEARNEEEAIAAVRARTAIRIVETTYDTVLAGCSLLPNGTSPLPNWLTVCEIVEPDQGQFEVNRELQQPKEGV